MSWLRRALVTVTISSCFPWLAGAQVGTVEFPVSAGAEAQEHFVRGVAILHSFGFEDAIDEFRIAQELEPGFALAYWGEAMAHNGNPLSSPTRQNISAAREALARLAPTRAERLAMAPNDREKGYLTAVELQYGSGDKPQRDQAYAEAMRQLHERYPEDLEAAAFYALGLLGTAGRFGEGYATQMEAAAIAENVFRQNPDHPGAAHYIIHAFDDPVHAPLALHAAQAFAKIAPDVEHALHMPAHIFVQRGMWKEVAGTNKAAYEASVAWAERRGFPPARRDFHALSWLQHAYLQQGKYTEARECLELIRPVAEQEDAPLAVKATLSNMEARYILETRQWRQLPVAFDGKRYAGDAFLLLATGISAARTGDLGTAERVEDALGRLQAEDDQIVLKSRLQGQVTLEDHRRSAGVLHKEVGALLRLARGQHDEALALAREATALEEKMHPAYGPPEPMLPPRELYAEILLELDRPDEAAEQFEQVLRRMPNRVQSLLGSARASERAGVADTARRRYEELLEVWGRDSRLPASDEARRFLSETEAP